MFVFSWCHLSITVIRGYSSFQHEFLVLPIPDTPSRKRHFISTLWNIVPIRPTCPESPRLTVVSFLHDIKKLSQLFFFSRCHLGYSSIFIVSSLNFCLSMLSTLNLVVVLSIFSLTFHLSSALSLYPPHCLVDTESET